MEFQKIPMNKCGIYMITSNDLLNKLEIEFISKYNTLTPNGYNLKSGGNQPTLSDITKQRMSESAKGRLLSEEHKRKLSIAQNKDWVKEKKSLTHRRRDQSMGKL